MPFITGEDYAAANIALTVFDGFAVFDCGILPHDKQAIVSDAATTGSTVGHAAVDHAAVHDELAVFPYSAAVCFHTAAAFRDAADDGAAIHGEYAVCITALNHHTAACAVGLTAHDTAAVHGERAAGLNQHTAAVSRIVHFCTCAAVDDAAMDGFCAAGSPLPQTVGVGGEIICRCGVAVLQRKVTAAFDVYNAAAAGYFKHIAVNIQRDSAVNGQGGADCNVIFQCDDVCAAVRQRINKLLFRFNFLVSFAFGKYACRHKAYHHTKGEQYT